MQIFSLNLTGEYHNLRLFAFQILLFYRELFLRLGALRAGLFEECLKRYRVVVHRDNNFWLQLHGQFVRRRVTQNSVSSYRKKEYVDVIELGLGCGWPFGIA